MTNDYKAWTKVWNLNGFLCTDYIKKDANLLHLVETQIIWSLYLIVENYSY